MVPGGGATFTRGRGDPIADSYGNLGTCEFLGCGQENQTPVPHLDLHMDVIFVVQQLLEKYLQ